MFNARATDYIEFKFGELETPVRQAASCVSKVQGPFLRVVICSDSEQCALESGVYHQQEPDYCWACAFYCVPSLLGFGQGTRPVTNRFGFPIRLFL